MSNNTDYSLRNRAERAIGEIVMAELFLVQATIESATALGEGLDDFRDIYWDNSDDRPKEELSSFLSRTREKVVEPYASRFRFLRDMPRDQDAA